MVWLAHLKVVVLCVAWVRQASSASDTALVRAEVVDAWVSGVLQRGGGVGGAAPVPSSWVVRSSSDLKDGASTPLARAAHVDAAGELLCGNLQRHFNVRYFERFRRWGVSDLRERDER